VVAMAAQPIFHGREAGQESTTSSGKPAESPPPHGTIKDEGPNGLAATACREAAPPAQLLEGAQRNLRHPPTHESVRGGSHSQSLDQERMTARQNTDRLDGGAKQSGHPSPSCRRASITYGIARLATPQARLSLGPFREGSGWAWPGRARGPRRSAPPQKKPPFKKQGAARGSISCGSRRRILRTPGPGSVFAFCTKGNLHQKSFKWFG